MRAPPAQGREMRLSRGVCRGSQSDSHSLFFGLFGLVLVDSRHSLKFSRKFGEGAVKFCCDGLRPVAPELPRRLCFAHALLGSIRLTSDLPHEIRDQIAYHIA